MCANCVCKYQNIQYLNMFNHSQDGVTISSVLDTRRAKDLKYPAKIRVTYRRIRKYYPTGKDFTDEEWKKLPAAKGKAANELKESIQISFDTVKSVAVALIKEGLFSFELLNTRLGRQTAGSVNSTFKAKIEELKEDERPGTEMYYANVLSSVEKFKGENITFASITPEWLKKYEKWLLSNNLSYSTVGMYMRAIRAIVNIGKKDGIIKPNDYPFGPKKYSIPTGEGRKLALTMPLIKKVIDFNDGVAGTARYRDLWFLSYLTNGANIGDLLRLKDIHFVDGEVRFFRAKTIRTSKKKKEVAAIVTPEIIAIIERWGVKGRKPNDYIFPYLKGKETPMQEKMIIQGVVKRINKKLKIIGDSLGLVDFTTYSARHSFATVLKRSGANIAYISESLGHPDVKTTENYLDSFEKSERQKNALLLTNFAKEEEEQKDK